jgi:uncharacterized membrane protein
MALRLGLRVAAIVGIGALYVGVSHWLMTRAPASPWNMVGVLAPMLAAIALGAWRANQRWLGALSTVLLVALCAQAVIGLQLAPGLLYMAQHVGVNAMLAAGFGSTLRAGHTPLITTLARRVHRNFTPEMQVYTRKCTLAWTLSCGGIALVSVALYAFAPFDTWAFFANLVSPVTVAVMFGGEYLLRYRLHPEFERASVADAIRSYMHSAK